MLGAIYTDVSYHLKSQAGCRGISKDSNRMRKSKQEGAETRRRMVKAAAAKFRLNGIGGTGLSELIAAAGLTHGGFYRHFGSKDQLVAAASAAATDVAGATVFSHSSP